MKNEATKPVTFVKLQLITEFGYASVGLEQGHQKGLSKRNDELQSISLPVLGVSTAQLDTHEHTLFLADIRTFTHFTDVPQ